MRLHLYSGCTTANQRSGDRIECGLVVTLQQPRVLLPIFHWTLVAENHCSWRCGCVDSLSCWHAQVARTGRVRNQLISEGFPILDVNRTIVLVRTTTRIRSQIGFTTQVHARCSRAIKTRCTWYSTHGCEGMYPIHILSQTISTVASPEEVPEQPRRNGPGHHGVASIDALRIVVL